MTAREEHINKINETKKEINDKNISVYRRRDLERYLLRLYRELRFYDKCKKK